MSFKEIFGQEKAIALLKTAVLQKRLSHAYIFVGPAGVGKRRTALNFAKRLLCDAPHSAEPCDACASCRKAESGSHPDIQDLSPDGQFIKIDAVREACRRLTLKGFESSRKVLIISDGGALNEESSNALLKTLEEPAPDTVIVLLAETLKSVLPTIASRCQRIIFAALDESIVVRALRERFHLKDDEAGYLARISEGCLERALRFHEEGLFEKRNALADMFFASAASFICLERVFGLSKKENRQDVQVSLLLLLGWLRDLLVAKASGEGKSFINADKIDDIINLSRRLKSEDIEAAVKVLSEAAGDVRHNINMRVALGRLNTELWKLLRK